MLRNLARALFTYYGIITTKAKAKALRPFAERLITIAKNPTLSNRRLLLRRFPFKDIVKKLIEEIAPQFKDRPGGYTQIIRLGKKRRGDDAELVMIKLVGFERKTPKKEVKEEEVT